MFHNIIGYYQSNIFDQEDFVKLSQSDVNFIPTEHQSEYHMYLWDSSASVFYRSYFIVTLAFLGKYCDLWRFVTQLLSDGPSDNEDDKRRGLAWQLCVLVENHRQQISQGWWVTWEYISNIHWYNVSLDVFHDHIRLQYVASCQTSV